MASDFWDDLLRQEGKLNEDIDRLVRRLGEGNKRNNPSWKPSWSNQPSPSIQKPKSLVHGWLTEQKYSTWTPKPIVEVG